MDNFQEEVLASLIRLPLAALLGTVLALRPRRRGTPERQPAVVQTQIILAVVGSLIMLVVGASLARAFGIVGAANLIRYRSKIEDPKDAVVMLCALSAGLAAGRGPLRPRDHRHRVHHAVPVGHRGLRAADAALRADREDGGQDPRHAPEDRGSAQALQGRATRCARPAEDALVYMVTTPRLMKTDRVSNAIMELEPEGKGSVEWVEKSKDKVPK